MNLTDIKIDLQRWHFRFKKQRLLKRLEKQKREAIKEANRLKDVTGIQHRVMLVENQYIVRSRRDLLGLNKRFPRLAKLNAVKIDKFTIYVTK